MFSEKVFLDDQSMIKINRKNINNNIISDLTGAEALDLKRLFLPEGFFFFDLCIP